MHIESFCSLSYLREMVFQFLLGISGFGNAVCEGHVHTFLLLLHVVGSGLQDAIYQGTHTHRVVTLLLSIMDVLVGEGLPVIWGHWPERRFPSLVLLTNDSSICSESRTLHIFNILCTFTGMRMDVIFGKKTLFLWFWQNSYKCILVHFNYLLTWHQS